MKLKLDEKGNVVVVEGRPVYVHEDGREVPFDAPGTVATITRLNGEAKQHRERAEAAEAKLKTFEGIEDPGAAKKALDLVKNIDDKKLVDAGKVEEIKAAARKAADEQVAALTKAHAAELDALKAENEKLTSTLHAELIGGSFSRSKFLADRCAVPLDMVQNTFGKHFKIEDGKVVAYDSAGNKVFSRVQPGEVAGFEEALETIIGQYPHKDSILKADVKQGSGAKPSPSADGKAGKLLGTPEERTAAIAARFPQLSAGG